VTEHLKGVSLKGDALVMLEISQTSTMYPLRASLSNGKGGRQEEQCERVLFGC
jgi:hypothetical protein